jgi:hypothetical protein
MNDEATIKKTVRITKRTNELLEEIIAREFTRKLRWGEKKVSPSDLVRQGIFIVLAAFGDSPVMERGAYLRRRTQLDLGHPDLKEKLPVVLHWPDHLLEIEDIIPRKGEENERTEESGEEEIEG